ncbi:MAG: hypothetical protein WBD22_00320 [Pyrinomonadaceae bacterium]
MKKIDMSQKAIERRLRQVDELHSLSVSLLRAGMNHYEKLIAKGKATEKELARFKKHLV